MFRPDERHDYAQSTIKGQSWLIYFYLYSKRKTNALFENLIAILKLIHKYLKKIILISYAT